MRAVKKTASYPKVSDEREKQASTVVDITQLYVKLKEKEEVFLSKVENEFFIFKPLGRKDWKDISLNSTLNQYQKEEVICEVCTVFPRITISKGAMPVSLLFYPTRSLNSLSWTV